MPLRDTPEPVLNSKLQTLSRPWMRTVVHRFQLRSCQLRIPLRRRQPLVPQHFLDRPQVRALLQHVRAKRMPQRVRMHIGRQPTAQNRDLLHNPPHTSRRQPARPPPPGLLNRQPPTLVTTPR